MNDPNTFKYTRPDEIIARNRLLRERRALETTSGAEASIGVVQIDDRIDQMSVRIDETTARVDETISGAEGTDHQEQAKVTSLPVHRNLPGFKLQETADKLRETLAANRRQNPKLQGVFSAALPSPSVLSSVVAEVALPHEGVQSIEEAGPPPQEIPDIPPPPDGDNGVKINDLDNTSPLGEIVTKENTLEGEVLEPGDQGPVTIQDDYHPGNLPVLDQAVIDAPFQVQPTVSEPPTLTQVLIPGGTPQLGEADGQNKFEETRPPEEDLSGVVDTIGYPESPGMNQSLSPLKLRILKTEEMKDFFQGKELQVELGGIVRHLKYNGLIIGSGDNLPMTWKEGTNIYDMNEKLYAWLQGGGYFVLIPFEFLSSTPLQSSGTIFLYIKKGMNSDYYDSQKDYMLVDSQEGTSVPTTGPMGFDFKL